MSGRGGEAATVARWSTAAVPGRRPGAAPGGRRPVGVLVLAAALAVAACNSGPSGPGSITASVEGDAVGGVVVEVRGAGIVGFEGLSSTRVYAAPVAGRQDTHRVMLINPDDAALRFEIQVDDLDVEDPVVTIVSAAGLDNETRLTGGIQVRIER